MTPSPLETKLQELERLATDVVREAHMRPGYIGVSQKAEALKAAITDPSIRTALQDERGRAREAAIDECAKRALAVGASDYTVSRIYALKESPPGEAQGWRTPGTVEVCEKCGRHISYGPVCKTQLCPIKAPLPAPPLPTTEG